MKGAFNIIVSILVCILFSCNTHKRVATEERTQYKDSSYQIEKLKSVKSTDEWNARDIFENASFAGWAKLTFYDTSNPEHAILWEYERKDSINTQRHTNDSSNVKVFSDDTIFCEAQNSVRITGETENNKEFVQEESAGKFVWNLTWLVFAIALLVVALIIKKITNGQ